MFVTRYKMGPLPQQPSHQPCNTLAILKLATCEKDSVVTSLNAGYKYNHSAG